MMKRQYADVFMVATILEAAYATPALANAMRPLANDPHSPRGQALLAIVLGQEVDVRLADDMALFAIPGLARVEVVDFDNTIFLTIWTNGTRYWDSMDAIVFQGVRQNITNVFSQLVMDRRAELARRVTEEPISITRLSVDDDSAPTEE